MPVDRVKLNHAVVSVEHSNRGVVVRCINGEEYEGSHVILATAPPMQMKIHFSPSLGPLRTQLMQRMPMGSVWKLQVYYKVHIQDLFVYLHILLEDVPIRKVDIYPSHGYVQIQTGKSR